MYQAELKGKISSTLTAKEDLLTSNVFSFFKYADRGTYLLSFLKILEIDVSGEEAHDAEFHFWPTYDDRTEPDVVIIIGDYYLLFEAKYFADFGSDQLVREYQRGFDEAENIGKRFKLIAITADYSIPAGKFIGLDFDVAWINWQSVTLFLEDLLKTNVPDQQFAEDLYRLLLKKNLRPFRNFLGLLTNPSFEEYRILFFDYFSAKHRGEFVGFQKSLESRRRITFTSANIFFSRFHRYDWEISKLSNDLSLDHIFWRGNE